jgi:hypothetical protein
LLFGLSVLRIVGLSAYRRLFVDIRLIIGAARVLLHPAERSRRAAVVTSELSIV